MKRVSLKPYLRRVLVTCALGLLAVTLAICARRPSHDRAWELGQARLPKVEIVAGQVTIEDLRDFAWRAQESETPPHYQRRSFALSEIEGVDVVISHFATAEFLAHDFLNFRIRGQEDIGISVETRREVGEGYHPFTGLLNSYELIYVIASYRDLVSLRKDIRGERVYRYPTVADAGRAQALFIALAEDINRLREHPQFYNTLTNNCTNVLARKVELLTGIDLPYVHTTLAPGYLHEALYELDLIEKQGSFEATKAHHRL